MKDDPLFWLAALEPIMDMITQLKKDAANRPTPLNGADGVGVDAARWAAGVYREGAVVTHFLGQVFRAIRDTAAEPGGSDDWQRLGLVGLRWRGAVDDDARLEAGDLVTRDGSLFQVDYDGQKHLVNYRGERGPRGKEGPPGKDGKDGGALLDIELGTDSLIIKFDGIEREIELGTLIERVAEMLIARQVAPVLVEIGQRLVNLERRL